MRVAIEVIVPERDSGKIEAILVMMCTKSDVKLKIFLFINILKISKTLSEIILFNPSFVFILNHGLEINSRICE